MKWEMVDREDGYRQVNVEVPWEEIAPDYDDILDSYVRLKIPGFRPGKVPRQVLESRFQREIGEQMCRHSAQRLGRLALEQAGAEPAGPVEVSEVVWEKGRPLRFSARFFPLPEFELPVYQAFQPKEKSVADPQGELSLRLLELVRFAVPDELVRGELACEGMSECQPGSAAWQAAARRVRLMLILKRIALKEGIEVEESDVQRRIEEKAAEFGTSPDTLRADLDKGGGRARLKDLLVAESVLAYLLENLQD
jgi:FKBP-type peptidyl-prolyl cis-trans isomerase (trigger factor)